MESEVPLRHVGPLIKIETDRRLGHEWDEWDGGALDNGGDFTSPTRLYFGFTAVGIVLVAILAAAAVYLLAPRLAFLSRRLPLALYLGIASFVAISLAWLTLLALSVWTGRALLPEKLAERGLLLRTLNLAWRVGELFGVKRDWTDHASVVVYNRSRPRARAARESVRAADPHPALPLARVARRRARDREALRRLRLRRHARTSSRAA